MPRDVGAEPTQNDQKIFSLYNPSLRIRGADFTPSAGV